MGSAVGVGGVVVGVLGSGGVGEVGVGVPDRDTNPPPTPTVFQAAHTYFIRFASNRLCVKSSLRQVARVQFVRVKLSCTHSQPPSHCKILSTQVIYSQGWEKSIVLNIRLR